MMYYLMLYLTLLFISYLFLTTGRNNPRLRELGIGLLVGSIPLSPLLILPYIEETQRFLFQLLNDFPIVHVFLWIVIFVYLGVSLQPLISDAVKEIPNGEILSWIVIFAASTCGYYLGISLLFAVNAICATLILSSIIAFLIYSIARKMSG